ncbi:MAG: site-2 protease family protein [Clostridium sp.]|uniref:site-2 protease family protein n=1 Tax=Clostridium sp. TaxID=1506 RepID=UPI003EE5C23C
MKKSIKSLILEGIILVLVMTLSRDMFIAVISVVLHEISHIIVGKHYGCKLYDVKIALTGASASLSDIDDLKDMEKLNLYMAGPMFNLLVFTFIFCINRGLNNEVLRIIGDINLGIFIFNIIPVYPLDGSRILEIIFSKIGTFKKARQSISNISYIFSGILICIFSFYLIRGEVIIGLPLISGLIVYSTYIEKKAAIYIMMKDLYRKGTLIEKYEYIENRSISVSQNSSLLNLLRMVDKNKFNIFYVLDEELKCLGQVREDEVIDGLKKFGNIEIKEYLILKNRDNSNESYL